MGNFVGNTVSSGSVIFAADHNELVNRIGAVVNGGLDDTNISGMSGAKLTGGTVPAAALATAINPNTLLAETIQPFVQTGCVWSSVSGLNGAMTAGVIYVGPSGIIYRVSISSVTSHGFTASKDTYIDIDYTGVVTYQEFANNATSPALAANSIRIAIVVTGASAISSINQGSTAAAAPVVSSNILTVSDSLGNLIYPCDPQRRLLGYRQITGVFTGSATTADQDITGLNVTVSVPTGRKIRISAFGFYANTTSVAGANLEVKIKENTTVLADALMTAAASAYGQQLSPVFVTSPSAGSHTYKLTIATAGAGAPSYGAAATSPAFIMVELV